MYICIPVIIAAILPGVGLNPLEVDPPVVQITLEATTPPPYHPGDLIAWSVHAQVLTTDNLGLGGIGFDLVQTDGVGPLILEPANFIPSAMAPFDRPRGIAPAAIGGVGSGFGGTQILNFFGGADLYSLGGIQNNFGAALPLAQGIATDAVVVPNVALGINQLVASGVFEIPTVLGSYRVDFGAVVANVFTEINSPPQSSFVIPAVIEVVGQIEFQVVCSANFDGIDGVDVADLFGYINAWLAKTPNADFNHDAVVDVADLFGYINAWLAKC